jgi:hypothetical protein
MDFIDRYVIAVSRHLPAPVRDEVSAELADSLRSEAEERERLHGAPLAPGEQIDMLKRRGHPWLLASRYLPQQHLIGPSLFPYYRRALSIVIFWIVLPAVLIGGAIRAVTVDATAEVWSRALGGAWTAGIYAVGILTILFAILERQQVRLTAMDRWDPSRLPEPRSARPVSRFESTVNLVFSLSFLVWWIDLIRLPRVTDLGSGVLLTAAPAVRSLYWPIAAALGGMALVSLVDLVRPWRTRAWSFVHAALDAGILAIVVRLLIGWDFVLVEGSSADAARLQAAASWINVGIAIALVVVAAIVIADLVSVLRNRDGSPFHRFSTPKGQGSA